jgi:glutamate-ammonia-ligase adenylyltransferase
MVQVLQLQYGHRVPDLRTTSTLQALDAAVLADLLPADGAEQLRSAWLLASRLRSAMTLLTGRTSDVLPMEHRELDGVGRLLGYPDRGAMLLEEEYLRVTRRARRVFEKQFYG